MITPKSQAFPWPSLTMEPAKIVALTQHLMSCGVKYGLGDKIAPLSKMDDIDAVDCSGFVRWLVYHATADNFAMPDGSVVQHQWCENAGFKKSSDGGAKDGAIRIAFLSPKDGGGVGHVVLIVDGMTCESHGHHGPDRRVWGSQPWMSKTEIYVLTPPTK